jgi:hypothetical protein
MIEQYLPNNNETAKVASRQKFCQLNRPQDCVTNATAWRAAPCSTSSSSLRVTADDSLAGWQRLLQRSRWFHPDKSCRQQSSERCGDGAARRYAETDGGDARPGPSEEGRHLLPALEVLGAQNFNVYVAWAFSVRHTWDEARVEEAAVCCCAFQLQKMLCWWYI